MIRCGIGYDAHRLSLGRKLILGGVEIPHDRGLDGHSDADVLCHAIADALLGAIGEGDIGHHFPNTDESIRGISSLEILRKVTAVLGREKRPRRERRCDFDRGGAEDCAAYSRDAGENRGSAKSGNVTHQHQGHDERRAGSDRPRRRDGAMAVRW